MPALTTPNRALLAALALGAFAAAYGLSENAAARGAADARTELAAAPERRATTRGDETLHVGRDPFVAALTPAPSAAAGVAPSLVRGGLTVPVLPPNAGAGAAPPPAAEPSLRITAFATGARPYAIAESGGTTRIVTIGERLGDGRRVERIDAAGVRLSDGALLTTRGSP